MDLSLFQVLILRNFGAICVGETIEETTYLAYLLVTACEQQVCDVEQVFIFYVLVLIFRGVLP